MRDHVENITPIKTTHTPTTDQLRTDSLNHLWSDILTHWARESFAAWAADSLFVQPNDSESMKPNHHKGTSKVCLYPKVTPYISKTPSLPDESHKACWEQVQVIFQPKIKERTRNYTLHLKKWKPFFCIFMTIKHILFKIKLKIIYLKRLLL